MKAYKCDVCKELFENKSCFSVTFSHPKPANTHTFQVIFYQIFGIEADLCEVCYKKAVTEFVSERNDKEVIKIKDWEIKDGRK